MLLLLKYWQYMAMGVLLIALASSGVYVKLLQADKSVLIAEKEKLDLALDISAGSIKRLQTAVDEQNTAIDKLHLASTEREKANQVEVAKVKTVADTYKKRANELLGRSVPKGSNVCDAANSLYNEEINRNGK